MALVFPIADLTGVDNSSWHTETGTLDARWARLTDASDSTYIHNSSDASYYAKLAPLQDPGTTLGHIVHVRARGAVFVGGALIRVTIWQGDLDDEGPTIKITDDRSPGVLTGNFVDYAIPFAVGEADGITDYADLTIELQDDTSDAARVEVSRAWLEVPDATTLAMIL